MAPRWEVSCIAFGLWQNWPVCFSLRLCVFSTYHSRLPLFSDVSELYCSAHLVYENKSFQIKYKSKVKLRPTNVLLLIPLLLLLCFVRLPLLLLLLPCCTAKLYRPEHCFSLLLLKNSHLVDILEQCFETCKLPSLNIYIWSAFLKFMYWYMYILVWISAFWHCVTPESACSHWLVHILSLYLLRVERSTTFIGGRTTSPAAWYDHMKLFTNICVFVAVSGAGAGCARPTVGQGPGDEYVHAVWWWLLHVQTPTPLSCMWHCE